MAFEFSPLKLPPIKDRMSGPEYENLKDDLIALMLTQRMDTFQSQASADGPWPALASNTMRGRQAKNARVERKNRKTNGVVMMLQDTGLLRSSFTGSPVGSKGGEGAALLDREKGEDYVKIGTPVEYARIHNEGGTIQFPGTENGFGRGVKIGAHPITIPARPFDQFTDAQEDEITDMIEEHLGRG